MTDETESVDDATPADQVRKLTGVIYINIISIIT